MKVSLRAAVESFDASQFSDLEYGISDEDAAQGLRDTFKSLGIEWDEDCLFYCGQLESPAERKERLRDDRKHARERSAWRKANPEAAAAEARIAEMMTATSRALSDRIMDDVFKPSLLSGFLRGDAAVANVGESPNWRSYSDTLTLRVDEDNRG